MKEAARRAILAKGLNLPDRKRNRYNPSRIQTGIDADFCARLWPAKRQGGSKHEPQGAIQSETDMKLTLISLWGGR